MNISHVPWDSGGEAELGDVCAVGRGATLSFISAQVSASSQLLLDLEKTVRCDTDKVGDLAEGSFNYSVALINSNNKT